MKTNKKGPSHGIVKAPLIKIAKRNKANKPVRSEGDDDDEKWYYYGHNKTKRLRYKFCAECNFKTYSKPLLNRHAELHHPYSTNDHSILQAVKESKSNHLPSLSKAYCLEKKANQDECEFCSFYSVQNHTEDHLLGNQIGKNKPWVFLPVNFYSCSYCSQRLKALNGLISHEMLHIRKSHHQCPSCSYSVTTRSHLMRHFNAVHNHDDNIISKDVEDDIFIDMVPYCKIYIYLLISSYFI